MAIVVELASRPHDAIPGHDGSPELTKKAAEQAPTYATVEEREGRSLRWV